MKKILGIVIPIFIILTFLGALVVSYSAGKKGIGCDLENEPGAQIGMKYFQSLIDTIEQYRTEHGTYPEKLEDINQNIFANKRGFPHPNITGASINFKPNENYFTVGFTFNNDYICPMGQSRKCTYGSGAYWGGKETEKGRWRCE